MSSTKSRSIPTVLYHYTNGDALLEIIRGKKIWATSIHYLNDAKEFAYAIDIAQEVINEQMKNIKEGRLLEAFEPLSRRLDQIAKINVFVASFSAVGDSLSQWRSYCSQGAGYSIGFSVPPLSTVASEQGFSLEPCIYDQFEQMRIIQALLKESIDSVWFNPRADDEPGSIKVIGAFLHRFIRVAPTLKHAAFQDELEWRLISVPIAVTDRRWQLRAGKSMLVPFVPIQLTGPSGELPICEICVGPTPHVDLATASASSLLSTEGAKNWTVKVSQVPFRDW